MSQISPRCHKRDQSVPDQDRDQTQSHGGQDEDTLQVRAGGSVFAKQGEVASLAPRDAHVDVIIKIH